LNADKLLATGFEPNYGVVYAIKEIINAYEAGKLEDKDGCYNVRTMKSMQNLS